MERWYHQAVIVLWPKSRHFEILARQGASNAVPALAELLAMPAESPSRQDGKRFAQAIIKHWVRSSHNRSEVTESLGTSFIRSLIKLGDAKLAKNFFEHVLSLEYRSLDGELLVALAELAKWKSIEKPLVSFFHSRQPQDYWESLTELVATFGALVALGSVSADRKQVCKALLPEVFGLVDRWEKSESNARQGSTSKFRANKFDRVVEPLLRGVCAVGTRHDLQQVIERITTKGEHYDLHHALIPAARALASDPQFVKSGKLAAAAERELRQFCIDE